MFINFGKNPTKEELVDRLVNYTSKASELGLPHAPKQFIQYLTDDDRPQVKKDVDYEGGMGVSIGRLREDSIFDWKFVGLAHNTLRGAAGGRFGKRRNAEGTRLHHQEVITICICSAVTHDHA